MTEKYLKWGLCVPVLVLICVLFIPCCKDKPAGENKTKDVNDSVAPGSDAQVVIDFELPKPVFEGTKEEMRIARLEPLEKPRLPFYAPAGTRNVALRKPVTSTTKEPMVGDLGMVTDGDKEAMDGSFVELGPGPQTVTIDLQETHEIYAILFWHYHLLPRAYFDVVVQVADDPDFIANVRTLFNNDDDNSCGLGIGSDMNYLETYKGKLVDAKGVRARYVRLSSNGNSSDDGFNHYTEVEVFGRPVR